MHRHYPLKEYEPKFLRDTLRSVTDLAAQIHALELKMVLALKEIDKKGFYVWYGCKSLRGFCESSYMRFTRVQSQRIVTAVRRLQDGPSA